MSMNAMGALGRAALAALLLAGAAAAQEARPFVGEWRLARLRGAESFDAARTQMRLSADGRFSATVGCNRVAGSPKISGAAVSFGPLAATRMACPPPLGELESKFFAALEAARGFRLEGASLLLLDAGGAELAAFRRAE